VKPRIFFWTVCILFLMLVYVLISRQDVPRRVLRTITPPAESHSVQTSELELVEQWRFRTGIPNAHGAETPPFLFTTSDRVVVGHYVEDDKEQSDSVLTVLALENGQVLWQTQYQSQGYGTEILSAYLDQQTNRLFIFYSFNVSAIDLETGAILWTTPPLTTHTSYVFSPESGSQLLLNTDHEEQIIMDPANGQILSKQKTGQSAMTIWHNNIKLTRSGTALQAFDQEDNLLWEKPGYGIELWPTFLDNGDMVVESGNAIFEITRMNLQTGGEIWKSQWDYASNYAVMGNRLYALRRGGSLEARDLETGKRIGTVLFDRPLGLIGSRPFWVAVSDPYLVVYLGDSQEIIAFK